MMMGNVRLKPYTKKPYSKMPYGKSPTVKKPYRPGGNMPYNKKLYNKMPYRPRVKSHTGKSPTIQITIGLGVKSPIVNNPKY